jgi:hypothetical protein
MKVDVSHPISVAVLLTLLVSALFGGLAGALFTSWRTDAREKVREKRDRISRVRLYPQELNTLYSEIQVGYPNSGAGTFQAHLEQPFDTSRVRQSTPQAVIDEPSMGVGHLLEALRALDQYNGRLQHVQALATPVMDIQVSHTVQALESQMRTNLGLASTRLLDVRESLAKLLNPPSGQQGASGF